jgi:holo-[acyl-carrier protein] synthase
LASAIVSGQFAAASILGIGVDAVDIDRFAAMLDRTPTTLQRIFTEDERAYASGFANPVPSLAARFAAREATMKALGVGLGAFDFHDVWIARESSGRPVLMVEGAARDLAQRLGVTTWNVSLTHTSSVAIAYVIATGSGTNL